MLRDYISLTLGVLTLLIASGAVYGILSVNTQIQAKSEPATIPDYTNELDSLKSQINSMNTQIGSISSRLDTMSGNLSTLDAMKNSLTDANAKLIELEKNTNQISSSVPTPTQLSVILDKSVYLQGDTIKLAAIGAMPLKAIQIQLVDSSGYVVINSQTYSDSAGKISYNLQIPSSQLAGNYQVKLTSDQQATSTPIIIQSSTSSTSGTFTAQTDKTTYNINDLVQVTGTGTPNTAVTGIFTSPTGYTATSGTTANGDGSYTILFDILPSYETGTWTISLSNGAQIKSLSIHVQSGSSTTYTLTAQTSKSTYNSGDTIQISGSGTPNTAITGVLTSPTGRTYNSGATVSTGGSYTVSFSSLQYYETGTWTANMNNAGQSKSITFYMQASSTTFTAQTSQSSYTRGAVIQVSGVAQPNTVVNGVLTSPSGTTSYTASSTAQSDGTYSVFFPTTTSYATGSWSITVTNSAQSKTLYVLLQ